MASDRAHAGRAGGRPVGSKSTRRRVALTSILAATLAAVVLAPGPATAQSSSEQISLTEIIFDLPCRELVGATAEEMLVQNTVVGSIFTGFITANAPEDAARAMLADIYNQSILLGAACEFGDGSLYEAMGAVVEGFLAAQ